MPVAKDTTTLRVRKPCLARIKALAASKGITMCDLLEVTFPAKKQKA